MCFSYVQVLSANFGDFCVLILCAWRVIFNFRILFNSAYHTVCESSCSSVGIKILYDVSIDSFTSNKIKKQQCSTGFFFFLQNNLYTSYTKISSESSESLWIDVGVFKSGLRKQKKPASCSKDLLTRNNSAEDVGAMHLPRVVSDVVSGSRGG